MIPAYAWSLRDIKVSILINENYNNFSYMHAFITNAITQGISRWVSEGQEKQQLQTPENAYLTTLNIKMWNR